ncbi:hypothetical protein [uncultured Treponema sp.]|uniref:hypothetical protein n=1 Tax=uncultured Treponema sp. TaxID=162155 RepID=UPI0025CF2F2D|nr:hypothetical protein [uncultured Treponema sp.]
MSNGKRKPAALIAAEKKIIELEKQKESAASMRDYYEKQLTETRKDLEQVNEILDKVPFAPPRKNEEKEYSSEYTATQRISMWVSNFMVNIFRGDK